MKSLLLLSTLLLSFGAHSAVDKDIQKVRAAMKSVVGISTSARDTNLAVYKVRESICGSEETSAIIIDLQVVRFDRASAYDPFKSIRQNAKKLETVKRYAVLVSDVRAHSVKDLPRHIMDAEACME